jgi:hypothetical protein
MAYTPGTYMSDPTRGVLTLPTRLEVKGFKIAGPIAIVAYAAALFFGILDQDLRFLAATYLFLTLEVLAFLSVIWLARREFGPNPSFSSILVTVVGYLAGFGPALIGAGYSLMEWVDAGEKTSALDSLPLIPTLAVAIVFPALELLFRHWHIGGMVKRLDVANKRADVAVYERRVAEARLQLLQAQIEPHFLFNTLGSVKYLVTKDATLADFMLGELIHYLRDSMPMMRETTSTLAREFSLVRSYLNIARLRTGGRLDISVTLPGDFAQLAFPPLMLQTLVENALKHGIEPKLGDAHIDVFAELTDAGKRLRLTVRDDGVGIGGAPTAGTGAGLRNIRERLESLFGEEAKLRIEANPTGGAIATIEVAVARLERAVDQPEQEPDLMRALRARMAEQS